MAIKKLVTTDLFNQYITEQIKPCVDSKVDNPGLEASSHQPYHFLYHIAFTPTADSLVAKAFTITLDNNKTLTQYDFTLPAATTTTAGIMTAEDKAKLDACSPGNYVTLGTTQEITGQKTFTQTIKGTAIQDKDDLTLNATFTDICDAVTVVSNFQTRKDLSPVDGNIELPAENVKFTLQSLTAKGIADNIESVTVGANTTSWKCGDLVVPILEAGEDINLFKTGNQADKDTVKYAYDSINFETKKIDRYTIKLSLWDILHEKTEGEATGTHVADWTWNNTGGTSGSIGVITLTHAKMNQYFGTYSPQESESIQNFGFHYELSGVFADTPGDDTTIVMKANKGTFAISGFKNRIAASSGKNGVFAYILENKQDAENSYIIMKRQTKLEETIPTTATIHDTFRGSADAKTYIEGLNAGTAKVGFLSVADKFYTKAQIDEEFQTKAYFNDKQLIVKATETVATSSLYGDLYGYGKIVYAEFSSNDGTVPFFGPTLFIRAKNSSSSSNYWIVISSGSLYHWTSSNTSTTNTLYQPYAARCAQIDIDDDRWDETTKQVSINLTEEFGITVGDFDMVSITPCSGSEQLYIDCGITRTISGSTVTFTAETLPTETLELNIVYQKGEQLGKIYASNNTIQEVLEQINPDDLDA